MGNDDRFVANYRIRWGSGELVMDTFTLDPRCWRIGRIFGRNPLIRRADRIEA